MDASDADLWASYCSVELAKRSGCGIQALLMPSTVPDRDDSRQVGAHRDHYSNPYDLRGTFSFVVSLANARGVSINCHFLRGIVEDELVDFFKMKRITCLVISAQEEDQLRARVRAIAAINNQLNKDERWYNGPLRMLIARPWDAETFDRILADIHSSMQLNFAW